MTRAEAVAEDLAVALRARDRYLAELRWYSSERRRAGLGPVDQNVRHHWARVALRWRSVVRRLRGRGERPGWCGTCSDVFATPPALT